MKNKHIHFIGIGGIGMSGIAYLLLAQGSKVTGSDLKESNIINDLRKRGAGIFIGHNAENVSGAQVVVYSSAVKQDNPEITAARSAGVTIIRRAEALASLMQNKNVVTVAGSHGKTTTTSLAAFLLDLAGLAPTMAIGGILKNISTNASSGSGDFFVAEADESDGSFLCYSPKYSLITNIDREHLDYYQNFENELEGFSKFAAKVSPDGCIIACADDKNLKEIVLKSGKRHIFFGLEQGAQFRAENIAVDGFSSAFDCVNNGKLVARFSLSLAGLHNISNSLAVIALGLELGIDREVIKKALLEFKGAGRRMEIKLCEGDFLIVDDYAHHPTEINATLTALRKARNGRIIAVFQPHRFSRTNFLIEDFGKCFTQADTIIITDIYAASEDPIAGVNAEALCKKVKQFSPGKEVIYLPKQGIIAYLQKIASTKDTIITLGAGDITKISDELAKNFTGFVKV